nr:hypothetical protein [Tanacetum cinerariifolium]
MKIIIGHYMTNFPEISRRARDEYHNLKDDDLKKISLIHGYKDKVRMKILDSMISEEMKQTEHYRMYAEVFRINVPLIQSSPTETTQGTHRIPSAPRSPTPKVDASSSTRSTVIRLRLPQQKSTRLIPPAPVLTVDKADELILQNTLQHVVDDSSIPKNDEHNILGTRLEPRSDKKSLEVGMTDVVVFVNVYDEEEEEDKINDEVHNQVPLYVAEGLILEMQKTKKDMEKIIAKAILQDSWNIQAQISSQIQQAIASDIPSQVDTSVRSYLSGHILHVHPAQPQTTYVPEQQYQLYLSMKDDPQWQQQDIAIWLALQMKFKRLQVPQKTCRTFAVRPRDQDDPHDDAHREGEKSAKRHKTLEKADDYDFWTDSYASNDDEIPTKQVSQDIMEEESLTVDEAKLNKNADKMLRQRCTLEDEHQYHIDQMKNFLKVTFSGKVIFYIRKQKETGKPKEVIYSNSKIVPVIKTYWELGHEHKFITKIIAGRANDCIVSITRPDFQNLNKNDIEDMYLLIMNEKVPDYAETGLLCSLSVFIRSSVI